MMDFGYGFMGGFGSVFMLVFWGLVIWGLVVLARASFGNGHACGHGHGGNIREKSPLDILKERYAKGEIDKSEFEEKKKDLL